MSLKYTPGNEIDLTIERIVPRGYGIGFAEGLTVFVPLAVAGDRLRVRLVEVKKKIAFARIVVVNEASRDRIDAPCGYFGRCGGCNFQQMNYAAQLKAKSAIISDCLQRIGKIDIDNVKVLPSPVEFAYRSKTRFHADRATKTIGYFARDSHDVVDVTNCPILTPETDSALGYLRTGLDWEMLLNDSVEIDAASDGEHVSIHSNDLAEVPSELKTNAAGFEFLYSAESFFQANRPFIDKLVETAIGGASGKLALDLYCGVGLFALPLSKHFEHVIGVEDNSAAVTFAERNAARAGIANAEFHSQRVKNFLFENDAIKPDLILIDPPRAGAERGTIERIIRIRPRELSYVSCEPSILARDLRMLMDAGYAISSIVGLDLFPQTHHVETVVRLNIDAGETFGR